MLLVLLGLATHVDWLAAYFAGYEPLNVGQNLRRLQLRPLLDGLVFTDPAGHLPWEAGLLYVLVPSLLIGPPTLLMEFAFPVLQRVVQTDFSRLGRHVGTLLLANIAGSAAGTLLTGWVSLNLLGTAGTLKALLAVSVVLPFIAMRVLSSGSKSPARASPQTNSRRTISSNGRATLRRSTAAPCATTTPTSFRATNSIGRPRDGNPPARSVDMRLHDHQSRRRFLTTAAATLVSGSQVLTTAPARKQPRTTPAMVRRLPRLDLMTFLDADGNVRPVTSTADWQRRRTAVMAGMQAVMGDAPTPLRERRAPPAFDVLAEVDAGAYVRRTITYAVDAGPRTPAYLLIPKRVLAGKGRAAAILCLHPTDNEIGAGVVVGMGNRPNRAYAAELADRGFVTLAPAYPLLADYQPDVLRLGYASGTMKAITDNRRGLDLLESLPFVRPGAIGAIGHSLGGHNAVYTSVFDQRIGVVVSSCGLDLFVDYYGGRPDVWQPEKGWCQVRYMPRLLEYAQRLDDIPFDFAELIGALAPRVCFLSAPTRDSNFRWESVARIAAAARPVYALHGAADRLIVEHPDADHDFPLPMRELAYDLFARHLGEPLPIE